MNKHPRDLKNNEKGQLSLEYIFVMGFIFVISVTLVVYAADADELATAMAAARSGAIEGANMDCFAVYPEETFENNTYKHPRLTSPSNVKIVKVDYINQGYNSTYKKTKIQLRIWASAPSVEDGGDRNCLGDRINYHARKSICESFETQNLTSASYNPVFTRKYVFTTGDVKWV
jgi:uncharacterized protein (UPF0333 family)